MCDVLDKVENRGIAKGKAEEEDTLALLMKKLFDQNRIEDAKRASEDKEYRARLMKEFGHLLEDTPLTKVETATNEVTINGVKYTLQAGKYTVAVTDDTMTITYTYGNNKTVTIPGGATK